MCVLESLFLNANTETTSWSDMKWEVVPTSSVKNVYVRLPL